MNTNTQEPTKVSTALIETSGGQIAILLEPDGLTIWRPGEFEKNNREYKYTDLLREWENKKPKNKLQ